MVDRHYFLNLKSWSARTLYVYAHADLAQKYSSAGNFCLQVVLPGRKLFFPALCNSFDENRPEQYFAAHIVPGWC
jgi:hypothetical protein